MLEHVVDERDSTLTIVDEAVTVPGSSPYRALLGEVPDAGNGVMLRRITAATKTGAGSGQIVPGGLFTGMTTRVYKVEIDTQGDIGAATFKWYRDNVLIGSLIPIEDTDPISLELGITVAAVAGTGTDFILGDYWTFTAEYWTEVSVIPVSTTEFMVDYVTGRVTFIAADAGKVVYATYEGRGTLVSADLINAIIDILNGGSNALRGVNTSAFVVGDLVAVENASTFQKANATDGTKPAVGCVSVVHATEGEVVLSGPVGGLTGLTTGALYYLSTTAGGRTTTPPATVGNIQQVIGRALSTTQLLIAISQNYVTVTS